MKYVLYICSVALGCILFYNLYPDATVLQWFIPYVTGVISLSILQAGTYFHEKDD